VDADDRRGAGVSDRLLRLSVGLEDVEDLWDDLDRALGERPGINRRTVHPAGVRDS
jgi:methionine-gamma-lyase